MRKVPKWMQQVICFTQNFPCADTRNRLLTELLSGQFDHERFERMCRDCHIAFDGDEQMLEEPNQGAFFNRAEAIRAAGHAGRIESMQGVLHILLND